MALTNAELLMLEEALGRVAALGEDVRQRADAAGRRFATATITTTTRGKCEQDRNEERPNGGAATLGRRCVGRADQGR